MLELSNLIALRNDRELFSPVTVALGDGECLELVGANGSGKSTLLRTLAGLHEQFMGRFTCADYLYQGHRLGLDEVMTPLENLSWFLGMEGLSSEEGRIREVLERVDMHDFAHRPSSRMSQGQKRRISVARWMLSSRPIWILDEPFSYLDLQGIQIVNEVIKEKCSKGGIVVCATHVPLLYEGKTEWSLTPFDGLMQ